MHRLIAITFVADIFSPGTQLWDTAFFLLFRSRCGGDGRLRTKDFQVISSKARETNSVKPALF